MKRTVPWPYTWNRRRTVVGDEGAGPWADPRKPPKDRRRGRRPRIVHLERLTVRAGPPVPDPSPLPPQSWHLGADQVEEALLLAGGEERGPEHEVDGLARVRPRSPQRIEAPGVGGAGAGVR